MKARLLFLLPLLLLFSCVSTQGSMSLDQGKSGLQLSNAKSEAFSLKVPDENTVSGLIMLKLLEGSPESLLNVLEIIRDQKLETSEYGRSSAYVASVLLSELYPDTLFIPMDKNPPESNHYVKVLKESLNAKILLLNQNDALDTLLQGFSFFIQAKNIKITEASEVELSAKAVVEERLAEVEKLFPASILPPLFLALAQEEAQNYEKAIALYDAVLVKQNECEPALSAKARLLLLLGKETDAELILTNLYALYPRNIKIIQTLGFFYFHKKDYVKAEPLLSAVLIDDPLNKEALLARSEILVNQKRYSESSPLLDAFSLYDPLNVSYLRLRARVQWEGARNSVAAIATLDKALIEYPNSLDFMRLKAEILLSSNGNLQEALVLSESILSEKNDDEKAYLIALQANYKLGYFERARQLLEKFKTLKSPLYDYKLAYQIYLSVKDNAKAYQSAEEWYQKHPDSEESINSYIKSLILQKNEKAASDVISKKLKDKTSPRLKSDLYFLRSRLTKNEDSILLDLRQSLMENPQNAESLSAMFELYYKRKDYKTANAYLKQVLALKPEDAYLMGKKSEIDAYLQANK